MSNRQMIYDVSVEHAKGHIKTRPKCRNPHGKGSGVGEHPDILEAIEKELQVIAQYSMINLKYLKNTSRGINE